MARLLPALAFGLVTFLAGGALAQGDTPAEAPPEPAPLPLQPAPQPPPPPALQRPRQPLQPGPTRYETERRPLWYVLGPGIGLLAGGYVGYLLGYTFGSGFCDVTCSEDYDYEWALSAVPIVGPWLNIGVYGADFEFPLVMGLLQAVGLTLFTIGLAYQPERVRAVDVAVEPVPGGMQLAVTLHAL